MASKYKVILMPRVKDDLVIILDKIAEVSLFSASVKKWNDKILDLAFSLDFMPERFASFQGNLKYRLAKVGKYALLYHVDKDNMRVLVMRIIYARRDLKKVELK
ncbi:type II toxin-antitoxin system RelE/ParE family toxin [Candidatus Saccharibacteria bacterium]|nr:type II toxin-antitoxin system RelE/ParE family toxin [Candidatus Saccharibacteria bacterium]